MEQQSEEPDFTNFTKIEFQLTFQGYRQYVAYTYIGFNVVGFVVNTWVMYVIAPLLIAPSKVPKSILFYILSLCIADLLIMFAMLLLIIELVMGTWTFSSAACTAYLAVDAMNKFIAPIIVFLISRACYQTVCLDKQASERAAGLRYAIVQVVAALVFVCFLLWPVFAYAQVYTFYLNPNNVTNEVTVMHKCSFLPPTEVEFWFNLIACVTSYAIPLFGIIYWYVSVPFFLKRRAIRSLVNNNSMDAAMKKVITTVILLAGIYVVCWSPYWFNMFAHRFWSFLSLEKRTFVIVSYLIHLLPYISCSAYPLIFTVMNRGIRVAHAKVVQDHKRKFKYMTGEASNTIRNATSALRSQFPSKVPSRGSFLEVSVDGCVRKASSSLSINGRSKNDSAVSSKISMSSDFDKPQVTVNGVASPPLQQQRSPETLSADAESGESETLL
ncbi:npr-29 [Pristionchus pacificus]|uniref:Npr-29 n=1 Tax=Pristionchus pacificus TaxID=54126 RepID=A0A2A6C9I1_PRIPA|nr:npr-29 [Pristionchus pacificus]|eukprot:PDM74787.1 npr-29 [Pristionchus pacificus]